MTVWLCLWDTATCLNKIKYVSLHMIRMINSSRQRSVTKRKKKHDIQLDLAVTNFGPIREGKIHLKPLTIFMGPNNSGKSYMAILIHSILGARVNLENIFNMVKPEHISKIRQKSRNSPNVTNDITIPLIFKTMGKNIHENISKNFSAELSNLIKIGEAQCSMDITTSIIKTKILLTKEEIKCNTANTSDNILRVGIRQNNEKPTYEKDGIINITYVEHDKDSESVSDSINSRLFTKLIKKFPFTLYIPPSRYGIIQAQQVLAASLLHYVPHAGISRFTIPEMPGVVRNFLSHLLFPYTDAQNKNIVEYLEASILDGKIKVEPSSWKAPKKMEYVHKEVVMPLHMVSSSVSEMISLVIYLQHLVRPGCLLIIEEPESHLDPQNQLHLAKCIVNLIRIGVNVLITTHSPYMVEQLGNYMQIGGLKDKRSINVDKDDYILPNELVVYDFERDGDGVIIKPADVSTVDGITQRLFTDTYEKISELAYSLEDAQ